MMKLNSTGCRRGGRKRRGITITEVMVGCSVLAVILPTMTSLFVRSRRLMQQTRHQRLVLDELSSQIEVLMVDPSRIETSRMETDPATDILVSPALLHALPSASMSAEITQNESGRWIRVSAEWQHGQNSRSQSLVSWIGESNEN